MGYGPLWFRAPQYFFVYDCCNKDESAFREWGAGHITAESLQACPILGLDTRFHMRLDLPCYCATPGTKVGGGAQRLQQAF